MIDVELELRAVAPTLFREPVKCGCLVGPGWLPLLRDLCMRLEPIVLNLPDDSRPIVEQIKEKFGGLRFYVSQTNQDIEDAIDEAEGRAYRTCESCGSPGEMRRNGWLQTLCDSCNRKRR